MSGRSFAARLQSAAALPFPQPSNRRAYAEDVPRLSDLISSLQQGEVQFPTAQEMVDQHQRRVRDLESTAKEALRAQREHRARQEGAILETAEALRHLLEETRASEKANADRHRKNMGWTIVMVILAAVAAVASVLALVI
jgi:hypothetical protein